MSGFIHVLTFLIIFNLPLYAQHKPWSLQACLDTGIRRNIQLRQQQTGADISRVELKQSIDNLYPSVNITDAPGYNFGKTQTVNGSWVSLNTASNAFAVSGSITLFDGFQLQNTIRESAYAYQSNLQTVESAKNTISLNIFTAYMQVLASYEGLKIVLSQLAADSQQVEETRVYVTAGKYPVLNLLQVQSTLANDRSAEKNAENQIILSKVNLMQLMNIPVDYTFDIVQPSGIDSILTITSLNSENIYNAAAGFLPQVKAAELNSRASESALEAAKALYYPKLVLNGSIRSSASSLNYTYTNFPATIGYVDGNPTLPVLGNYQEPGYSNTASNLWNQFNDNFNQYAGLDLVIPLFSNFTARNGVAIAKLNVQTAQLNQEAVNIALRQAIEQAYTGLLTSAEQYKASNEALISEAATFGNMKNKYETGAGSATDYLIEESNYTRAKQNVVQAKYNYLLQVKLIDFYLGKPLTF